MPTATVYGETDDGHLFGTAAGSYATARSTATSGDTSSSTMTVGQTFVGGVIYRCYRTYIRFDTSALGIPGGATITGATLYVCAAADNSTTDFDIKVYRFEWITPLDDGGVAESNYDGAYGSGTLEGTLRNTSAGWTTDTYYSMAVDPAGINLEDYTSYAIVSGEDVANSAPTDSEMVDIYTADQSGTSKDPYLEVTYTLPGQPTTVRFQNVPFARLPGAGGARIGG